MDYYWFQIFTELQNLLIYQGKKSISLFDFFFFFFVEKAKHEKAKTKKKGNFAITWLIDQHEETQKCLDIYKVKGSHD